MLSDISIQLFHFLFFAPFSLICRWYMVGCSIANSLFGCGQNKYNTSHQQIEHQNIRRQDQNNILILILMMTIYRCSPARGRCGTRSASPAIAVTDTLTPGKSETMCNEEMRSEHFMICISRIACDGPDKEVYCNSKLDNVCNQKLMVAC